MVGRLDAGGSLGRATWRHRDERASVQRSVHDRRRAHAGRPASRGTCRPWGADVARRDVAAAGRGRRPGDVHELGVHHAAGGGVPSPLQHATTRPKREADHAANRPRGARPGQLDRRQGIDDPEARGARARGGQAGRPGDPVPGALLRPVLLPGPGRPVLQLHRADPRRPDDQADAGPRQADRHGRRRPDVRGGRSRRPASTTTPRPSSTPTGRTSASTARPTSRTSRASGRSSTSGPGTSATRCSRRPSARSACTSATTGTSRRARERSGSTAPRSCSSRRPRRAACRSTCGGSSSPATPSPTATTSGTINRVGIEKEFGDDDFYGQSYFVDPRGQFVGDVGDRARRGADRPRPRSRQDRRGPQHVAVLPRPAAGRIRRLDTPVGAIIPAGSAVRRRTAEPLQQWLAERRLAVRGASERIAVEVAKIMQFGFTLKPEHTHRAHARADAAGRGGRLRVRLAVRQPRPVAGSLSAADADGGRHGAAASRHLRHQPRHARAVGHGLGAGDPRRDQRRADGPRHRPGRLGPSGARQAADHPRPHRGGDQRHPDAGRRRSRSTTRARS